MKHGILYMSLIFKERFLKRQAQSSLIFKEQDRKKGISSLIFKEQFFNF